MSEEKEGEREIEEEQVTDIQLCHSVGHRQDCVTSEVVLETVLALMRKGRSFQKA